LKAIRPTIFYNLIFVGTGIYANSV